MQRFLYCSWFRIIAIFLVTWTVSVLSSESVTVSEIHEKSKQLLLEKQYGASIEEAKRALQVNPGDFTSLYLIGISYWRWGNYTKAEQVLQKAILLNPSNIPVRLDFARLQVQMSEKGTKPLRDVLQFYRELTDLYSSPNLYGKRQYDETDTDFIRRGFLELGNLYQYRQEVKDLQLAMECYSQGLASHIQNTELKALFYFHLGNVLATLGRNADAIESLRQALSFNPRMLAVWSNLGNVLRVTGDLEGSYSALMKAHALQPDNGAVRNNLGVTAKAMGRKEEALGWFTAALEVWPNCVEALCSLADHSQDSGNEVEAKALYHRAARSAVVAGRREAATAAVVKGSLSLPRVVESDTMAESIQLQYDANLERLHWIFGAKNHPREVCFLTNGTIALRGQWMADQSNSIDCRVDLVKGTLVRLGEVQHIRTALSDLGYYYMYFGRDNQVPREQFAQLVHNLSPVHEASAVPSALHHSPPSRVQTICSIAQGGDTPPAPLETRQHRVGFVSEFFYEHSVSKLVGPVIRGLSSSSQLYVVLILVPSSQSGKVEEDATTAMLLESVDEFVHLPGGSQQLALEIIRNLSLDLVVFPEVGMGLNSYLLALHRLAPVQAAYWGHGVTTGMPETVDWFVLSRWFVPQLVSAAQLPRFSESVWWMRGLSTAFEKPLPLAAKSSRAQVIPPQYRRRNLYLCAQTLYKIHPDMDRVLADILLRDRFGTIVLIAGPQPKWSERLLSRVYSAVLASGPIADDVMSDVQLAVLVLPQMPRNQYARLLRSVDVVLDTWPCSGGVSHLESMAVGAPVVVRNGHPHQLALSAGMYRYIGMEQLLANSTEEYVSLAIQIASNSTLQHEIRSHILSRVESSGVFANLQEADNGEGADASEGNESASSEETGTKVDAVKKMVDDWILFINCAVAGYKPKKLVT